MHALLLSLLVAPQLYKAEAGPLAIASAQIELKAPHRTRPIQARATYPKQPGKRPLIVFSHGFRGAKDNYRRLVDHWASHGYVVIQPNHTDSAQYLSREEIRTMFDTQGGRSFSNWAERPADVSFLISNLDGIERQVPDLKSRIDRKVIGIGGHSFGAHTTQLLSGATTTTGRSFKEKRAKAFTMISPQGVGSIFGRDSWKSLDAPCLFITGSKDVSITPTTPEQRRQPFDLAKPGDKYLLWIEGATHGFGGISGSRFATSGAPNKQHLAYVLSTTTAFWDGYLKSDKAALGFLIPNEIEKASNKEATLALK